MAKMYAGWIMLESTNIPTTNISAELYQGAGGVVSENDYTGNFTGLRAVFAHSTALGTATIGETGISFDSAYERLYRADINVAAWTAGIQTLRPEACGVLYDNA
jgi:hypothetical protein